MPRLPLFNLPGGLIAQSKPSNPERSRLLVVNRNDSGITHCYFKDLTDHLRTGDLLVLNDTAVCPARLWALRDEGGQVEVTLVSEVRAGLWEAIIRPDGRLRKNMRLLFKGGLIARLIKKTPYDGWALRFSPAGTGRLFGLLKRSADVNIPFYIRRKVPLGEYQTTYARVPGSTQCPTAGLHFTKSMLKRIRGSGIDIGFITLHIGGSVLPMTVRDYRGFQMYRERFEVTPAIREKVMRAKGSGRRVIAVGTTVVRALESAADGKGRLRATRGWTDLTITPAHVFKVIDGILTNFHLPFSSHLLLTCAFGGTERVVPAYEHAVRLQYRFLDFGDTMLIL